MTHAADQRTIDVQQEAAERDRRPLAGTGPFVLRRAIEVARLAAGIALAAPLTLDAPLHAAGLQPQLRGDTRIHDPSVIEVDGRFAAFGAGERGRTRGAIRVKTSPDGVTWTDAGALGKGVPEWAIGALGYQPTNVWAPSISRRGPTFIALAGRHGGAIEAPSIREHAGRFYLFVSFDQCCKGVASTYNIRVGRADRIEGPYLDKDGKAMLEGGGLLILATTGRFIGPGGQEPVKTSKGVACHCYDSDAGGVSRLQLSPILWTSDGWPDLGAAPH